nr:MAG TPA: hypothetical protein [Caudoviricetes sp.]
MKCLRIYHYLAELAAWTWLLNGLDFGRLDNANGPISRALCSPNIGPPSLDGVIFAN